MFWMCRHKNHLESRRAHFSLPLLFSRRRSAHSPSCVQFSQHAEKYFLLQTETFKDFSPSHDQHSVVYPGVHPAHLIWIFPPPHPPGLWAMPSMPVRLERNEETDHRWKGVFLRRCGVGDLDTFRINAIFRHQSCALPLTEIIWLKIEVHTHFGTTEREAYQLVFLDE